eukprot:m.1543946 g.1543946  ORF g.1543946 m.1543946 type:complete len:669 (+) comp25256_c0_seq48:146-2152(+)
MMARPVHFVVLSCLIVQCVGGNDLQSQALRINQEASAAFAAGDIETAVKKFKELDALIGHALPMGLTNLAVVYTSSGNHDKAHAVYKTLIKRFPKDGDAHMHYCRFGANSMNAKGQQAVVPYEDLVRVCTKATTLVQNNTEALVVLGSVHVLQLQFTRAWPVLERAVRASIGHEGPVHQQALTNLALANLRGGRTEQALEWSMQLYKTYGDQQTVMGTYAHTRSIVRPYDTDAVNIGLHSKSLYVRSLKHRWPNCKSGAWNFVRNYSDLRDALPLPQKKFTRVTLVNPTTAYTSYGHDVSIHFAKERLEDYRSVYHEHAVYRVDVHAPTQEPMVFAFASPGIIHVACTLVAGAFHSMYPTQEITAMQGPALVKVVEVDVPVLSAIPMYNTGNYYHWLCEGLVRILYARQELSDNSDLKVLVPGPMARHVQETLELLEIGDDRILQFEYSPNTMYQFNNNVTIIDWMHPLVDVHKSLSEHDAWAPVYQPKGGLQLVRDTFHEILRARDKFAAADEATDIVFVSRVQKVRTITNEKALVDILRRDVGSSHRVVVHTGKESILDQAAMFQRATLVIGAHGAGLSNLVFCRPGTRVMLFPMDPHVDHTYGHMCAALGLPHWIVSEIASFYYTDYGKLEDGQINIVRDTVRNILRETDAKGNSDVNAAAHGEL